MWSSSGPDYAAILPTGHEGRTVMMYHEYTYLSVNTNIISKTGALSSGITVKSFDH